MKKKQTRRNREKKHNRKIGEEKQSRKCFSYTYAFCMHMLLMFYHISLKNMLVLSEQKKGI